MAALGLCFCARAFSSCGKWGPLFIAVRGLLTVAASLVAEHRLQTRRLSKLWLTGPAALRHVGSSQTRARTRVPRIGRQTLNHCATREAPMRVLLFLHQLMDTSPAALHTGMHVNLILTDTNNAAPTTIFEHPALFSPGLVHFFLNLHSLKTWVQSSCAGNLTLGQTSFIFMLLEI